MIFRATMGTPQDSTVRTTRKRRYGQGEAIFRKYLAHYLTVPEQVCVCVRVTFCLFVFHSPLLFTEKGKEEGLFVALKTPYVFLFVCIGLCCVWLWDVYSWKTRGFFSVVSFLPWAPSHLLFGNLLSSSLMTRWVLGAGPGKGVEAVIHPPLMFWQQWMTRVVSDN